MNDGLTRRGFLSYASAFALSGCCSVRLGREPDLRFGLLSDVHITDERSAETFRKALRYYRDQNVDAVVICGDLTDHGLLPQLEIFARAWYEVFPNNRAPDGRTVEKLFVTGNHDWEGLRYRDIHMDRAFEAMHLTREAAGKLQLKTMGMAACWEKCFHEPYRPIWSKTVKGHLFVGANWSKWTGLDGLEDWFGTCGLPLEGDRPFFFIQHQHPRGTVYADDSWGDDRGQSVRALSRHPNAVALSGHSHRPLADARSYWNGEFLSVGASSLSYVCLPEKGRSAVAKYRENGQGREGQLVSVYGCEIVFERRDFVLDEPIDDPVVFETPRQPSTFTVRGLAADALPQFASGARPSVCLTAKSAEISFDGAFANPKARPHEYDIACYFKFADGPEVRVSELRYQPEAIRTRRRAVSSGPITCVLSHGDAKRQAVKAWVQVTPRNAMGGLGRPIEADARVN